VAKVSEALSLSGRGKTKALVGLLDESLAEDESLLELIERLIPSHMPQTSAQ
jgi:hypothetical protein